MKRFYIVRHGEQQKIPGDPSLSKLGITQAKSVGTYLQGFPISKIVASPITRAQETAGHISSTLGLTFETDADLKERVNWGDDPEQSFEDFELMWSRATQDRKWQPSVGDSSINAGKRLEKVILSMLQYNDEHIVLVAHGGLIADFLRNTFSAENLQDFSSDFYTAPDGKVKHCSITTVEVDTTGKPVFKIIDLASINHLML